MDWVASRRFYATNNELIDALVKKGSIQTIDIEKVFRSVDRKFYFPDRKKHIDYMDTEFQSNKIHLYAPSIYAISLECLKLRPGNKFLHIGSGIGYFSTLAGLLLGETGINHGIEIQQFLIDRAHQKLKKFKLNFAAIDYYHFCEPVFIQGNVCDLVTTGFYDRVYCGAGVPDEKLQFIKSLIKVGGLLITPLINGSLVKITREDEYTWTTLDIISSSFANFVLPENICSINKIKFPSVGPLTLQKLCRSRIRSLLSENLKKELPICTKLCSSHNVFMIKNIIDHFQHTNMMDNRLPGIMVEELTDDDEEVEEEEGEEQVDNELEEAFNEEVEYNNSDDNDDCSSASMCTKSYNRRKASEEILKKKDEKNPKRIKLMIVADSDGVDKDDDSSEDIKFGDESDWDYEYCRNSIDRIENVLSRNLKKKINSLSSSVPIPLKAFLNYDLDV